MERPACPDVPRNEPCFEVNPALWAFFCKLTGRESAPSFVWTESDVIQWLDTEGPEKANRAFRAFQAMGVAGRF